MQTGGPDNRVIRLSDPTRNQYVTALLGYSQDKLLTPVFSERLSDSLLARGLRLNNSQSCYISVSGTFSLWLVVLFSSQDLSPVYRIVESPLYVSLGKRMDA